MTDVTIHLDQVPPIIAVFEGDAGPTIVVEQQDAFVVAVSAEQGPSGPPGPPGATLRGTAAAVLNGHRAVAWSAGLLVHADPASPALSHSCAGIVEQAAQVGESVPIRADGVVTFSGWTWSPGPVWFGTDGVLTQTQPAGRSRVIGFGTGDKLNIGLQPPIDII